MDLQLLLSLHQPSLARSPCITSIFSCLFSALSKFRCLRSMLSPAVQQLQRHKRSTEFKKFSPSAEALVAQSDAPCPAQSTASKSKSLADDLALALARGPRPTT